MWAMMPLNMTYPAADAITLVSSSVSIGAQGLVCLFQMLAVISCGKMCANTFHTLSILVVVTIIPNQASFNSVIGFLCFESIYDERLIERGRERET